MKKWGDLKKKWDLATIELVMSFLTRLDKVQELIQLMGDKKEAQNIAKTIFFQDTFPFTYNVYISFGVLSNFTNPQYNINDFKSAAIVERKF